MRDKRFFYEELADAFDETMNKYDLARRLQIIFQELLPENLEGKHLLDAGCGTGWFSREAASRGARVASLDLGPRLLKQVRGKCGSAGVVGDVLTLPFKNDVFDYVIATELIEHTVNPKDAIRAMSRALKPGGICILTTPNKAWYFFVWLANAFRLRPYKGYENWMGWQEAQKSFLECGCTIERMIGFHLFPFVHPATYPLLKYCDKFGNSIGPCMFNIALRARKKESGAQ